MPVQARRCRWGRDSDERIFGQARGRHGRPPRFPGGRHRGVRRHRDRHSDARIRPDGPTRAAATRGRQVVSHRGRARGRPRRPPRLGGRAARPGHRAHRAARQIHQRRGGARFRPGTPGGDRGRPGAGARRAQAVARPADDREGGVQRRRPADDLGHPRLQGLAANRGCRRRRTAEGGRRRDHRQDQRAGRRSPTGRARIRSMAPPAIPTISRGRRAVRRAARPPHWRPAMSRSRPARTSAARCARRRTFAACSPTSRPTASCRCAATPSRNCRRCRRPATAWRSSGRWRAARTISRSRST